MITSLSSHLLLPLYYRLSSQKTLIFSATLSDYWGPPLYLKKPMYPDPLMPLFTTDDIMTSHLEKLKSSWVKDGWLKVSARHDELGERLILSGFLVPPVTGVNQQLNVSGHPDLDIQYGLVNSQQTHLGATAFEASIPVREYNPSNVLSISADSTTCADPIPWYQSWHLLPSDDLPFPPRPESGTNLATSDKRSMVLLLGRKLCPQTQLSIDGLLFAGYCRSQVSIGLGLWLRETHKALEKIHRG